MKALYTLEKRLSKFFLLLAPDLYERQRFIGSMLQPGQTVLDVGGEDKIITKRVPMKKYVSVNVEKIGDTDIVYDGKTLPFADHSFDVVLCIDVLEHVPQKDRAALIAEMLRVTNSLLICSAPLGTSEHIAAEKRLYTSLLNAGNSIQFLKEHIERGLPQPSEIQGWKERFHGELFYAGDYRVSNALFRLQAKEIRPALANHALFLLKLSVNFLLNLALYPLITNKKSYSMHTNRFYLIVRN